MPYMLVYLITIPSMYVLLVIYSFFNLWNVSWGTREVAQKKTKADMKKKKKEGLVGTLLDQFNLGGDGGETASVDFSLGNVMRCMCFTHDDPLEPKKQLIKISSSLDEVSKRLNRIESTSGISGSGMSRRRSSTGGRNRRSLGTVSENAESLEDERSTHGSEVQLGDESSDESEHESEQNKIERNDDTNPYWIEDEDLKKGPVDYLPGTEINFWRDLIEKYLKPLEMTKKEKDDQAKELKDYRDTIIFTFLMINVLYIVGVSMLQVQANLTLKWTVFSRWDVGGEDGCIFSLAYIKPDSDSNAPIIQIGRETDTLDMLGLFFLITFSSITGAQVVGMLFHRWQTCK
jgi:chitin synthase